MRQGHQLPLEVMVRLSSRIALGMVTRMPVHLLLLLLLLLG